VRQATLNPSHDSSFYAGPTLFTIYIDDLKREIKRRQLNVKIVKSADDTKGGKIKTSIKDRDQLKQVLQPTKVQDNAM
jgi:hypothetical protein